MNYKKAKLEFFYIRKSFFEYKRGFKYLKNKYFLAKEILDKKQVFEKPVNHNDLSVHLLAGRSHLIMCIWSLASFYRNMKTVGHVYLHSDGSLTKQDKDTILNFFPSIKIIEPEFFLKNNLNKMESYPIIKDFRLNYPQYFLLKKIIDPYFISNKKYHLIIDSDLAWFKNPEEIENEIQKGCQDSLMMENNRNCFIYFKDGSILNEKLVEYNSGVVLYKKENFDLEKFGNYLNKLDTNKKENKHFIEQAGYAYSLENLKKLPKNYTVAGDLNENTTMKHYTSVRRPLFYIEALEKLKKQF